MRKVTVITDSTAYLPKELVEKHNIIVVPQLLIWGEETLADGVDIQPNEFYQRLHDAKVMPTTAQVAVVTMQKAFEQVLENGQDALGIFISSRLSGTLQSALQGREHFAKDKERVEIIDSFTTSMALGFQVLSAARAAEAGASLEECKEITAKVAANTGVYFVVDTLEFLHRGGRIGGAQRLLGTALNLKPILSIQDGKVEAMEKIRTKTKAVERLIEIIGEKTSGKSLVRVAALHAYAEADAQDALNRASALTGAIESILASVSPVIGTHTGPGTIGIAYTSGY